MDVVSRVETTKRAVLYARVSGDDRKNEGRNLQSQLDMCREYAQERGWRIVAELSEDDRGAKGSSLDLEKLNQALEMARAGEYDVLVVREIDRFARSLAKQLLVEEELKRTGVEVEYVLGDYPDTPEGRLNKNIKAVIAEYEATKITERLTRGRRNKIKSGRVVPCGPTPYAYLVVENDGEKALEICEDQAKIVRLIYDWYTGIGRERKCARAIAKTLHDMRVPTYGDLHPGRTRKQRGFACWHNAAVRNILKNELYAGNWHYGDLSIPVPAIVSREIWDAAQKRRKENKLRAKRNRKNHYLLSQRVRCGECNGAMSARTHRTGGKSYPYYYCWTKSEKAYYVDKCSLPLFRADHVDAMVWDWVKGWLCDPKQIASGLAAYQANQQERNAPTVARLETLDDLLVSNRAQLERLLDLYVAGDFPKEMLTERKARLAATITALETEKASLKATLDGQKLTNDQIKTISEFAATVRKGLRNSDRSFEVRQNVVDLLDVRVVLNVDGGEKVAYVTCGFGKDTLSVVNITDCTCSPYRRTNRCSQRCIPRPRPGPRGRCPRPDNG